MLFIDISNILHVLAINVNIYPHLHYCLKVWGQRYFNETSHAHQGWHLLDKNTVILWSICEACEVQFK